MRKSQLLLFLLCTISLRAEIDFYYTLQGYMFSDVQVMYDKCDAWIQGTFHGGFINFGYWADIDLNKPLSIEKRIKSHRDLYTHVLSHSATKNPTCIVEVGCGQGAGTCIIEDYYMPQQLIAIDISAGQLKKARALYAERTPNEVDFRQARAENLPVPSALADAIVCVEAAQHFDMQEFVAHAQRVLRPGGELIITTFFAQHESAVHDLKKIIPTIDSGVDKVISIEEMQEILRKHNFNDVVIRSIGNHVWYGFDRWIVHDGLFEECWGRNWYLCYKHNLIDYYVIYAYS